MTHNQLLSLNSLPFDIQKTAGQVLSGENMHITEEYLNNSYTDYFVTLDNIYVKCDYYSTESNHFLGKIFMSKNF